MRKTHRPLVMGRKGMVAAGHPLASLAGMKVLMEGGNATNTLFGGADPRREGYAIGW